MPASEEYYRKRGKEYKPNVMHGYSGLNAHYAAQDPSVRAFPPGRSVDQDGTSASEIGAEAKAKGMRINRDGTTSPDRNFSARELRMRAQQGRSPGAMQISGAMTGEQASAALNNLSGMVSQQEAAPGADPSMDGRPDNSGYRMNPRSMREGRRTTRGAPMVGRNSFDSPTSTAPIVPPSPQEVRMRANEMAAERGMQRDMANGTSRTNDAFGNPTRIDSKFGTGTIDRLTPEANRARPPGMVRDDFGRMKTVGSEVNRMAEIQGTKGMPMLPGQPRSSSGFTAGVSDLGGFDPSKLRKAATGGVGRKV
jgi:hypothetical protein